MSFMYLHLLADNEAKLHAKVATTGPSLGTESSQSSFAPNGVFRIESFIGLSNIDDNDLIDELLSRFSVVELVKRLHHSFSREQLIDMLRERMK